MIAKLIWINNISETNESPTICSEAKKYKRKITAMLEEESQALRNLDVGRLDVRDLHKLASGRVNVFSQTELPQVKTAVAFALDGSGSMYGTMYFVVRKVHCRLNPCDSSADYHTVFHFCYFRHF